MTSPVPALELPAHVSDAHERLLVDLTRRNVAAHGDGLLGLVLSGSAGRGLATEHSDLDVYVVLTEEAMQGRSTTKSRVLDEVPMTLDELEELPPFGSAYWWYRWSFAWAPVLLDRTDGRLSKAAHQQAVVTEDEAVEILIAHDRLDGWLNYAYRALKSDRDGRTTERRLDAAESMPWLLDTVFALAGRVRPYHKYLPWELREHPLPDWSADELLGLLDATLDGDPQAIRTTFARVEALCQAFDERRPSPVLVPVVNGWGAELDLLRG